MPIETQQADRSKAKHATSRWALTSAVVWSLAIFGTSCTVVMPSEFFAWLDQHLFRDAAISQGFRIFWGFSWFGVVKGWHALEFAILFALFRRALGLFKSLSNEASIGLSLVLCIAFAASDEWHQTFVPGRGGTATDVLIDSLGALLAALVTLVRSRNVRAEPCCQRSPRTIIPADFSGGG